MKYSHAHQLESLSRLTIICAASDPLKVAAKAGNGKWYVTGSQYGYSSEELVKFLGEWILVRGAETVRIGPL